MPGLLYAKALPDCKKGTAPGQPGLAEGCGEPLPVLVLCPVPGPGSGAEPQACRTYRSMPSASLCHAKPSQPGGLLQLQSVQREAMVSTATLTS